MKTKDIDGAKGKKPYMRATAYDSFNYADITKAKFVSTRVTNPLQPRYSTRDAEGHVIDYGHIKGSEPTKLISR